MAIQGEIVSERPAPRGWHCVVQQIQKNRGPPGFGNDRSWAHNLLLQSVKFRRTVALGDALALGRL
jgi:hypothetical protein